MYHIFPEMYELAWKSIFAGACAAWVYLIVLLNCTQAARRKGHTNWAKFIRKYLDSFKYLFASAQQPSMYLILQSGNTKMTQTQALLECGYMCFWE